MDRSLLLYKSALRILGAWLSTLAYHVDTFNNGTLLIHDNLQHLSRLAFILAGKYNYGIIFLYFQLDRKSVV